MHEKTWLAKPGSALSNIVNSFVYDPDWNKVSSATDGEGNVTTFNYDVTQGTLLTITRPTIGGDTPVVTYTYNDRGQVLTRSEKVTQPPDPDPPTFLVDSFVYDETTEVLLEAHRDPDGLNLTTVFGYNVWGDVNSIVDPRAYALDPIDPYKTTFTFDNERRITQRTECDPFNFVTNWIYDDNGQRLALQRQTGEEDPEFQEWNWAYQVNGAVETITDPAGNETHLEYNTEGELIASTDAEGREWQFEHDELGRISSVIDPLGNPSETRTFTDNGMLATIEDARGNVTVMEYDGFDRLDTRTYPDTTFEQMTYNDNSQVMTMLTRKGDIITNTYDVLNRLSTSDPGPLPLQTMTYDLAGRLLNVNTPTVGGDPSSGDYSFAFDTAGRPLTQTMPNSAEVAYQLDENGNRIKLTWPDAFYANYAFDKLNRLTDITLNDDAEASIHFDYDDLSRRTGITYINGASCTYSYSLNNDLNSLEHAFAGSSVNFAYSFNHVHQVIQQIASDSKYMWKPSTFGVTSYAAANDLNQYPSVGSTGYGYDDNGNLTSGPLSASFDALNRLTQAISGGITNNYWNDPLGRQAQKEVNSTKTGYLFDGLQLIAEYDETPALVNRYIPGARLDEVLIQIADSTTTFLHQDRIGSTIAQTDDSGAVLNKYVYSPFGETPSLSGTIFGYTGQRFDSEIGVYNYKMRYYAPAIGRFLQPDPLGYAGGDMNLYGYVGNDPTNLIDPFGLEPGSGGSGGSGGAPPPSWFAPYDPNGYGAKGDPNYEMPKEWVCVSYAVLGGGAWQILIPRVGAPELGDIVPYGVPNLGTDPSLTSHYMVVTELDPHTGQISRVQGVMGDSQLYSAQPLDPNPFAGGVPLGVFQPPSTNNSAGLPVGVPRFFDRNPSIIDYRSAPAYDINQARPTGWAIPNNSIAPLRP